MKKVKEYKHGQIVKVRIFGSIYDTMITGVTTHNGHKIYDLKNGHFCYTSQILELVKDVEEKKVIHSGSCCPEMGQTTDAQITYRVGHYGGYYITTDLDLKGRGIKLTSDGKNHARGLKSYKVTELALNKLKTLYTVCYIDHLD